MIPEDEQHAHSGFEHTIFVTPRRQLLLKHVGQIEMHIVALHLSADTYIAARRGRSINSLCLRVITSAHIKEAMTSRNNHI
jgi:hypothetical protein